KFRDMTMKWLVRHEVDIDELIMRAADDWRTTPEYKLDEAQKRMKKQKGHFNMIVFDDRDDVVSAFKAANIVAIQIHTNGGQNERQKETGSDSAAKAGEARKLIC